MSMINPNQIVRRDGPQDGDVVIIIDKSVMKVFRRNVYLFAAMFCLMSLIPWTILIAVDCTMFGVWNIPPYIWVLMAFICQAILACFPQTRYTFPCNWILVLSIVLCLTIFGCHFMHTISMETFLVAVLIASMLLIMLHLCGAFCPQAVLPNSLCTGCILLLCILTLIVMGILLLTLNNPIYGLVFCIVLFVLVLVMIPFNSQYINGRLKFAPIADTLACALGIYIHFILLGISLCAFSDYYKYYND